MKTNFDRLCKWLFGNIVTMIMIPVTILSIIIGLYGSVFDDKHGDNYHYYFYPHKYINFFEKQIKLKDERIDTLNLARIDNLNNKIDTFFHHLIVLDRTMSTFDDHGEQHIYFIDTLRKSLKETFDSIIGSVEINPDEKDLKKLYVMKVCETLFKHNDPCEYRFMHYDGDIKTDSLIKDIYIKDKGFFQWFKNYSDSTEARKSFIKTIFNAGFYKKQEKNKQITNFDNLFKGIKGVCDKDKDKDKKIIVTIISDFYHDEKKIVNIVDAIRNMQTGEHQPIQYNLVYIAPTDSAKKIISQTLVETLKKYIKGSQLYVEINSNKYMNSIYNTEDLRDLGAQLTQCFSSIKSNKDIKFYYPRVNPLNFDAAECKVIINSEDTITPFFSWRITEPFLHNFKNNTPISYIIGDEKSNTYIDEWHSSDIKGTLNLIFPLNSNIYLNQYHLNIVHGSKSKSFLIKYNKFIPPSIAVLGIILIHLILVLLVVWIGLLTKKCYKHYDLLSNGLLLIISLFTIWYLYFLISCSIFIFILLLLLGIVIVIQVFKIFIEIQAFRIFIDIQAFGIGVLWRRLFIVILILLLILLSPFWYRLLSRLLSLLS
jgi:hypothetical protein